MRLCYWKFNVRKTIVYTSKKSNNDSKIDNNNIIT